MLQKTLDPCKYGAHCNRQNPLHFTEYSHPCKYGAGCTRKNPQHFIESTHPCKYGANCNRKNSDHFKQYTHPANHPSLSNPQTTQVDEGQENEDEDSKDNQCSQPEEKIPKTKKPAATSTSKKAQKTDSDKENNDDGEAELDAVRPLAGKSVALTGKLSLVRNDIIRMVHDLGGNYSPNVSKNVDYLIAEDPNSGSSKLDKARANGTKVVDENFLLDLVDKAKKAKNTTQAKKSNNNNSDNNHNDEEKEDTSFGDGSTAENSNEQEDPNEGGGEVEVDPNAPKPLHNMKDGDSVQIQGKEYTSS